MGDGDTLALTDPEPTSECETLIVPLREYEKDPLAMSVPELHTADGEMGMEPVGLELALIGEDAETDGRALKAEAVANAVAVTEKLKGAVSVAFAVKDTRTVAAAELVLCADKVAGEDALVLSLAHKDGDALLVTEPEKMLEEVGELELLANGVTVVLEVGDAVLLEVAVGQELDVAAAVSVTMVDAVDDDDPHKVVLALTVLDALLLSELDGMPETVDDGELHEEGVIVEL